MSIVSSNLFCSSLFILEMVQFGIITRPGLLAMIKSGLVIYKYDAWIKF